MEDAKKRKILVIVLLVLLILLVGLAIVISLQIRQARTLIGVEESPVQTATASISSTDNISVSYNLGSPDAKNENLDAAKDVANKFMQAKEDRSLEEAKAYMTEELYQKTNAEGFAGTSSPSMDRFEITEAQALKTPDTYQVDITSYWLLNGEDSGTVKYKLTIIKSAEDYLVDKFEELT